MAKVKIYLLALMLVVLAMPALSATISTQIGKASIKRRSKAI
jgi:hypothetical protein